MAPKSGCGIPQVSHALLRIHKTMQNEHKVLFSSANFQSTVTKAFSSQLLGIVGKHNRKSGQSTGKNKRLASRLFADKILSELFRSSVFRSRRFLEVQLRVFSTKKSDNMNLQSIFWKTRLRSKTKLKIFSKTSNASIVAWIGYSRTRQRHITAHPWAVTDGKSELTWAVMYYSFLRTSLLWLMVTTNKMIYR